LWNLSCSVTKKELLQGHSRVSAAWWNSPRGGTVLLNEIAELPLRLQAKLLTFLDTNSFMRVGGETSVTVDVRIIAATNRDLEMEVVPALSGKTCFID
jgi:DNA-binding NtrC family response regulator